jgi:hypothetical protein
MRPVGRPELREAGRQSFAPQRFLNDPVAFGAGLFINRGRYAGALSCGQREMVEGLHSDAPRFYAGES